MCLPSGSPGGPTLAPSVGLAGSSLGVYSGPALSLCQNVSLYVYHREQNHMKHSSQPNTFRGGGEREKGKVLAIPTKLIYMTNILYQNIFQGREGRRGVNMYINEDMRKEEKDKRDVVGIFQRRGERNEEREEGKHNSNLPGNGK